MSPGDNSHLSGGVKGLGLRATCGSSYPVSAFAQRWSEFRFPLNVLVSSALASDLRGAA